MCRHGHGRRRRCRHGRRRPMAVHKYFFHTHTKREKRCPSEQSCGELWKHSTKKWLGDSTDPRSRVSVAHSHAHMLCIRRARVSYTTLSHILHIVTSNMQTPHSESEHIGTRFDRHAYKHSVRACRDQPHSHIPHGHPPGPCPPAPQAHAPKWRPPAGHTLNACSGGGGGGVYTARVAACIAAHCCVALCFHCAVIAWYLA